MSHSLITLTLSAALTTAGTAAFTYPSGKDKGSFRAYGAVLATEGNDLFSSDRGDISVSLGDTSATVTLHSATTIPAGTKLTLQLNEPGPRAFRDTLGGGQLLNSANEMTVLRVNLGNPITADPDGICASQNRTGAGALTLNGALVSGGVAVLDRPRNIVVDSGGADTATITITGTDEYGAAVTEAIQLNGTTAVAGKKAFKRVTGVASDGTISNGAFIGTGDVLGLPVYLPNAVNILKELENGAAATTGTTVAGVLTRATTTTGDVRGTYDPNSACDGSKVFELIVAVSDPGFIGVKQNAA